MTYAEPRLGWFPFDYQNLPQLMYAHLNVQPNLAALGVEEQSVLSRALAKEPEERFPSCTAFVQALAKGMMKDGKGSTKECSSRTPPKSPVPMLSAAAEPRISPGTSASRGDGEKRREADASKFDFPTRPEVPHSRGMTRGLGQRPKLVGLLLVVPLVLVIGVLGWVLAGRGGQTGIPAKNDTNSIGMKLIPIAAGSFRMPYPCFNRGTIRRLSRETT